MIYSWLTVLANRVYVLGMLVVFQRNYVLQNIKFVSRKWMVFLMWSPMPSGFFCLLLTCSAQERRNPSSLRVTMRGLLLKFEDESSRKRFQHDVVLFRMYLEETGWNFFLLNVQSSQVFFKFHFILYWTVKSLSHACDAWWWYMVVRLIAHWCSFPRKMAHWAKNPLSHPIVYISLHGSDVVIFHTPFPSL